MITQDRLREVLHYDPATGVFTWCKKTGKKVVVGAIAGTVNKAGYIVIGVDGGEYYAHRLACIYMTGHAPRQVDHKDGVRSHNQWLNLRPATHQQNVLNAKLATNNTSGFKGVSWHKGAGRWSAYIILNDKKQHLGLFDHADDAHAAYMRAATTAQPEFARAS